jgi:hypothetical protein
LNILCYSIFNSLTVNSISFSLSVQNSRALEHKFMRSIPNYTEIGFLDLKRIRTMLVTDSDLRVKK